MVGMAWLDPLIFLNTKLNESGANPPPPPEPTRLGGGEPQICKNSVKEKWLKKQGSINKSHMSLLMYFLKLMIDFSEGIYRISPLWI